MLQDTSTGAIVAQHRTRMGTCDVLRQNPWNAVVQLGHSNGVVSMWTPNMSTPVVKMLCHKVRRVLWFDAPDCYHWHGSCLSSG